MTSTPSPSKHNDLNGSLCYFRLVITSLIIWWNEITHPFLTSAATQLNSRLHQHLDNKLHSIALCSLNYFNVPIHIMLDQIRFFSKRDPAPSPIYISSLEMQLWWKLLSKTKIDFLSILWFQNERQITNIYYYEIRAKLWSIKMSAILLRHQCIKTPYFL